VQALEREAERDEFNREIEMLKGANRDKEKLEKKFQDKIESYQAELDVLLEEKKSFVEKQAELELKINESNQTIADLKSLLFSRVSMFPLIATPFRLIAVITASRCSMSSYSCPRKTSSKSTGIPPTL